ncbi:MAG: cell wall-binding repeat-containing protein, partial [Erysipelotrichaceae bacterium]|nr:cell wall-binding repeat-containing protein [Erysipelotrichaceae bacterium]
MCLRRSTVVSDGVLQYTCTLCGHTYTESFEPEEAITRLSGKTRYETSLAAADALKKALGVSQFDAVILTTGENFADALAGSYLASLKNAPILLTKASQVQKVNTYIKDNLKAGGTVYVLGGEGAVKEEWISDLSSFTVDRLAGKDRYITNLDILEKSGFSGGKILVCVGKSVNASGKDTAYADSLSASAAKLPILLVNKSKPLSNEQKQYLSKFNGNLQFYIIGGTGAVPESVAEELGSYGTVVKRLSGKTRYNTSVLVAEEFFDDPSRGVLAYGENFPDGLCGGPLAAAIGSPIILTREKNKDIAADYYDAHKIPTTIVLGGTSLISDEVAEEILYDGAVPVSGDTYRITYHLGGGINSLANPTSYTKGDTVTMEDPYMPGYLFDGWYTDSAYTAKFSGILPKTKGDIDLYAKWRVHPLDITVTGMENMIWSWWYSPQVISHEDKVFWGFAENGGYSGVAEYDQKTGETTKTFLKHVTKVDDHNGVALTLMDDGRILSAFAEGHDLGRKLYIRISNDPYSIEEFDTEVVLTSSGAPCYSQLLHYDDMIYLFYRVNSKNWAWRYTTNGTEWSDEIIVVTAPEQYYCKFQKTTKDDLFRICMYSNPAGTLTDIRMGTRNGLSL